MRKLILYMGVICMFLCLINIGSADTVILRPDGAGTYTEYPTAVPNVAHYLNVDEVNSDGNTTHIYMNTTFGDYTIDAPYYYPPGDTFQLQDPAAHYGEITGITTTVAFAYRRLIYGSESTMAVKTGGQYVINGVRYRHSVAAYETPYLGDYNRNTYLPAYSNDKYTTSPAVYDQVTYNVNTGKKFTWGDIESLESGFVGGTLIDGGISSIEYWVTQVYTTVEYDPTIPVRPLDIANSTTRALPTSYINFSWSEGSINTDSYNVSITNSTGTTWFTGITDTHFNYSVSVLNDLNTAVVYAYNLTNDELSSESATDSATISNNPPTTPVVISPLNDSTLLSQVVMLDVLSTDADSDPITYYFYGGTEPSNMLFLGNNDSVDGSTFNWTLSQYDIYYWTAKASDIYSNSSNMSTVQFNAIVPPNLTSPVDASTAYTTYPPLTSEVIFDWQDTGTSQYRIITATDVSFNVIFSDIHLTSNTSTQSLVVNDEYWWRVYSYDGTTYSDSSEIFSFNLTGNSTLTGSAIEGVVYDDSYNGIAGAEVIIWNATWSDSGVTGSNGYYVFEDLNDGTVYSLQASADTYIDSSVSLVTVNSDPITNNFYLLDDRTSTEWWHYCRFTVMNVWGTKYENVAATMYIGDSITASETGTTGSDGAVSFHMDQNVEYRLTFIDPAQSINREVTLYPILTDYIILVSSTAANMTDYDEAMSDVITITIVKNDYSAATGYINVTYLDINTETTSLKMYLEQTNATDPLNKTLIGYWDGGATSSATHSFTVSDQRGQSYLLKVVFEHDTYGTVTKQYSITFISDEEVDGIPSWVFLYLAIFLMVLTGAIATSTQVEEGLIIVCIEGWIFLIVGWFNDYGTVQIGAALTVTTIIAIIAYIKKKENTTS